MIDSFELNRINIINISTQNNFCGYYALARRIINDNNFAVILDKFNQFYQTNWYCDQLVEVVANMHPEQADIMLGLVVHSVYPLDTKEGLSFDDLEAIYKLFKYNISLFLEDFSCILDSSKDATREQLAFKKISILYEAPKGEATIGHYNLIEPDDGIFAMDLSRRDPTYQGIYTINNQGGAQFIDNIKKSVAEIKPNWTNELKNQQVQEDKNLAWELAIADIRAKNLRFFKDQHTVTDIEKTQIIDMQRKEIEFYKSLLSS